MRSASRGGPFLKPKVSRVSASLRVGLRAEHLLGDPAPQHRPGQVAGVHDHVGALAQRAEQLALGADPLDDPPLGGQRVAAAGLLVAVDQRLLVGLEEERRSGSRPSRPSSSSTSTQVVEVVAAAHVGDDRGALHAAALVAEQLAERADHPRRQVVDAEVAPVLEGGDRLRLAGPRVAGDHDQLHPGLEQALRSPPPPLGRVLVSSGDLIGELSHRPRCATNPRVVGRQ